MHADYEMIKAHARASGFEPIERGTGGRLTMFDEHALAVTLLVPHSDPQRHTIERYDVFSGIIVRALKDLGVEARVGELQHEYCPGRFSINSDGRIKLVGIAQRMNRQCVQLGAVIAVEYSNRACAAIDEAYRMMGLPFDVATYGAIADIRPELSAAEIRARLVKAISEELCGLS